MKNKIKRFWYIYLKRFLIAVSYMLIFITRVPRKHNGKSNPNVRYRIFDNTNPVLSVSKVKIYYTYRLRWYSPFALILLFIVISIHIYEEGIKGALKVISNEFRYKELDSVELKYMKGGLPDFRIRFDKFVSIRVWE